MENQTLEVKDVPKAISVKGYDITALYSENVTAKILQVAYRGLKKQAPLPTYPHTVPQDGPTAGHYEEREALFWTCGFFPGSIYALLERSVKFPQALSVPSYARRTIQDHLLTLGRHWTVAIKQMSSRTDTHDMGFIVQPGLQRDWEVTGDKESLQCVVDAAWALASRWDERVKAIRSWDGAVNERYVLMDKEENFLVIIDSMCNLDLLFFASHITHSPQLHRIATQHAHTIKHAILRPNYSSYHLVNFDPRIGKPQAKMTNQGWKDESTWGRGQAWAILGFAQTYTWTKDEEFLDTAIRCAEYFLGRMEEGRKEKGGWHHRMVPVWDFDAPREGDDANEPLRDVSAGLIAANGLFIIHQCLQSLSAEKALRFAPTRTTAAAANFLDVALQIVSETLDMSYDRDLARFLSEEEEEKQEQEEQDKGEKNGPTKPPAVVNGITTTTETIINPRSTLKIKQSAFDAILRNSTTNWNEHAHQKYKDHGLVYADYYLMEFGNKLLRAGLV